MLILGMDTPSSQQLSSTPQRIWLDSAGPRWSRGYRIFCLFLFSLWSLVKTDPPALHPPAVPLPPHIFYLFQLYFVVSVPAGKT